MPVEASKTGSDDAPEIHERFFINLVPGEQFCVVTKVVEKPAEFPQRAIRTVEATGEGERLMGGGLQDAEAQRKERFLRMPAIGSPFDADQEDPIEIADQILLAGMETGNMSSHDLASTGWE
jgi:hypothetical protein